jgi:hypothetical protein
MRAAANKEWVTRRLNAPYVKVLDRALRALDKGSTLMPLSENDRQRFTLAPQLLELEVTQSQIAKELTLVAISKLNAAIADVAGQMYRTILEHVRQA